MKECTVPDCGRVEYLAHGFCDKHYKRWRKTGDPNRTSYAPATERFWTKVNKTDTCWLWVAAVDRRGYGAFRVDGRIRKTQQWAYEQLVGPIPAGLVLDHLCRTPACVNPDHLEPVTPAENARRARRAGHRGNPNVCRRGHNWDEIPPQLAHRSDGSVTRTCRVCTAQRRKKNTYAETHTGHSLDIGWLLRIEGAP